LFISSAIIGGIFLTAIGGTGRSRDFVPKIAYDRHSASPLVWLRGAH
jgi:hypothetical protein